MSLVTLSGVAKSHGAQHLFDDVDLQVPAGRRIAVVGPNGAGKTTLLEIITGDQQPDEGTVTRARDVVIGYLPQEIAESRGQAALAEVLAGAGAVTGIERRMRHIESELAEATEEDELAELMDEYGRLQHRFEAMGGYGLEAEARRILAGLGFAEADMERNTAEFSGGWMMRIALARLLLQNPDLLLLDEPTNHLDLPSIQWFEETIQTFRGALIVVSHDREFLERQAAAQGRKIAQVERFIERFRYKATKARQVQSRIKALDRMERVATPTRRAKSVKFRFPEPPRSGRTVITLTDIVKRYGRHTVYDGLDLTLERGQKVALIGPNGAGKSTLLKILAGVLDFDGGSRELGSKVKVAYFAQHQIDALNPTNTVYDELAGAAERMTSSDIRALLGAFLFSGDAVEKRVEVLSGGEQTRLALAKLMADPANLLCLDEPTNHLDITSRDVLEDALNAFPGTIVLITHDRYLIRSVANAIIEVNGGSATLFNGDFEYYAAKRGLDIETRGAVEGRATPRGIETVGPPTRESSAEAAARKRNEAEARNRRYQRTRDLRADLERVEAAAAAAEAELAATGAQLADPATYADGEAVRQLIERHNAARDAVDRLAGDWERLSAELESAEAESSLAESPR